MGKAATNLLLSHIESKKPLIGFEKIVLEPELLIRDSSAGKEVVL
jgi:DNA-binding LacI/PurR family transcriptional regulator